MVNKMNQCSSATTVASDSFNALPPPPPLPVAVKPERRDNLCLGTETRGPRAQLNGDPKIVQYLNFIVERGNSGRKIIEDYMNNSFVMYVDIKPELQVGPTCGLLALKMIANLVCPTTVDDLLRISQAKGFTKQGEMFSAHNMYCLAKEVVGEYCDIELYHGMLSDSPESVWDLLMRNRIFLVPYDKDKDNSPGIYNGHKAHWCVIVGTGVCSGVKFYCVAQGKSLKLSLWKTELLAASNKQLFEIHPDLVSSQGFVTTNVRDELAGHCICFNFQEHVSLPIIRSSCDDLPTTQKVLEHIVGMY